jgi:hypothetical protein
LTAESSAAIPARLSPTIRDPWGPHPPPWRLC